ncbi:uncharacterized protein LOC129887058 [Solanum dulcamara]|uniref:uncharacterized protein LOC129887058 n=1 Tax=Solanum dulcamara TaxID=45834 RepID=UPI002484EAC3|nr:uncharacterized protein LOC129887058 [Solanum dulcamara]
MTDLALKKIFEVIGPVESFQLTKDPKTGHSKGFGFVQYAQLEDAKRAHQTMNGKLDIIEGHYITVVPATEHVEVHDAGAETTDFNDDGGGLQHDAKFKGTG